MQQSFEVAFRQNFGKNMGGKKKVEILSITNKNQDVDSGIQLFKKDGYFFLKNSE